MKIYFIYIIKNTLNGKYYIGKHETTKIDDGYFGSGTVLKNAIKKYGKDKFIREIIEFCDNSEILCEREIFWISELNSFCPNGYNINVGGRGGDNYTNNPNKEIIREKFKNKSTRKYTNEERIRCSIRMKGKKLKPHLKLKCEYCESEISKANYNRWHGDNCKLSPNYVIKKRVEICCDYCGKFNLPQINAQYHGDYCKENPNRIIKDYSYKANSFESIKKSWEKRREKGNDKQSEESNIKRSQKLKGRTFDDDTLLKMSISNKVRWENIKSNPIYFICEFCGKKTTIKTNYLRWHGVKCKKYLEKEDISFTIL
jgi:hypothetical protein